MAIIGDIRRKGGWLIAILVGMALLAFILNDWLGPKSGSGRASYEIGEIAGEPIPARGFEDDVQEKLDNIKEQRKQTSLDQATIDMIREQTWNQLLNTLILGAEYVKLGLSVHPDEVFNLVTGPNPHQSVVQAFSNPETGQFNSQDVIAFLKNMDSDPTGARRAQWLPFEQAIKADRLSEKYFNMIKKGLYATTKEAMLNYEFANGTARFKYVLLRYSAIPDSAVTLSESELSAYYNEHRKEHEQEASRSIRFVAFDVLPSHDDSLEILDWADRTKTEFAGMNGLEDISSFVNMNADTRYDDRYYKEGELSPVIDSVMFNTDSSVVVGPYIENGAQVIARWVERDYRPDSVKARHILIAPTASGDSSYIKQADSLIKKIRGGADFASLAQLLSTDKNSAVNGGDVGWFTEGTMVKPFNDTCFSSKVGDVKLAVSQFGAHIIEVTDMTKPIKKVKVGMIDRRIEPSSQTFAKSYAEVNKFAGNSRTSELFEANANEAGLVIRDVEALRTFDKTIVGLENPREVIRWAYKEEKGAVSGPFELGNKYVVAVVTSVREKGLAALDDIRTEMEVGARKKKKAELMIGKLKTNDDQNLEDLAANLSANNKEFDLKVESVERLSFADFNIAGIGREPRLIGRVFSSRIGELSQPVEGNAGVFVFTLSEMNAAPENQDFNANRTRLNSDLAARVDYEVFNALKKESKIVDNRHLFY